MTGSSIVVLGAYLVKMDDGSWRTTRYHESDDFGVTGDWYRVLAGSYLFREKNAQHVVVSGGIGQLASKYQDPPTIASVMKQELVNLGVPEALVIVEEASINTYQQLRNCWSLLTTMCQMQALDIVSNRYHLDRILAMVETIPVMHRAYRAGLVNVVAAEDVILRHDPSMEEEIRLAYASEAMKARILLEQQGVHQIKAGTYKLG